MVDQRKRKSSNQDRFEINEDEPAPKKRGRPPLPPPPTDMDVDAEEVLDPEIFNPNIASDDEVADTEPEPGKKAEVLFEPDSDDESSDDEAEANHDASQKVTVCELGNETDAYKAIHGEDCETEEFNAQLATYTREQWAAMVDRLFHSTLDTTCSNRELLIIFKLFHHLFCYQYKDEYSVVDRVRAIYPHAATMKEQLKKIQRLFGLMHFELLKRKMVDEETRVGREIGQMLTRISFGIKMTFEQMVTNRLLQKGVDKSMKAMLDEMSPLTFFQELDTSKLKKHQQLLHFFYREAFKHGYRKDHECLYEPRYNEQGDFVYAYKYVSEMSDFVFHGLFPVQQNHYWFECLTEKSGNAKMCIDILTNVKSEWLPDLERNADIHSFRNGLYVLSLNSFFFFKKMEGRNWVGQLSGNLTAIKYHDLIFDEDGMNRDMERFRIKTYMSIEMEGVHTVLAHQKFEMDEREWILCLLGRLLHKVNQYDNWSVFIYFLGLAGTGKSTLLRLTATLLEARDVGYLNNSLQKTFSLDGIQDKLMYLALDIDENFQLDQVTWQSMVSGEEVSVSRKYKRPITVIWQSHGGFAGNKLPGWTDNSGSLSRRLIVIEFLVPVSKSDPILFEKCVMQTDRYLKVTNSAYLSKAAKYKDRGIKEVMPVKFKLSEQKALLELNILVSMIKECCDQDPQDGNAANAKKYLTTMETFTKAFKEYCRRNSIKAKTMNYNFYTGVFSKFHLKVIIPEVNDPLGMKEKYITGIKLKDHILEQMNNVASS